MTSKNRNKIYGFTLLELMVVVLLLGLLASIGVSVSKFEYMFPKYELRGEARKIGDFSRLAKSKAAGSGYDVYLQYDLDNRIFWILSAVKMETEGENAAVMENQVQGQFDSAAANTEKEKVEYQKFF